MVESYSKPVFLQTPGNDLRLIGNKEFYFQRTVLWQGQFPVKSSSDRKKKRGDIRPGIHVPPG